MVERTRKNVPGNAGKTKDTSAPAKLLSLSRSLSPEKNDDLIVSLADRYENRRAQQVREWERLYGQNVYQAF